MGMAVASNMPIASGIVTGIVGGIIVGFISGSPMQVSGPAAGLTVVVWQLVDQFGLATVSVIIFFAGLVQLLAGMLKLGQWFRAVSPAVVHGMLAGIGILILASQFHVMFDAAPHGSGIQNLLGIPTTLMHAIGNGGGPLKAGFIAALTIAAIIAWTSYAPKSLKIIPAPLVGVALAMAVAAILHPESIRYVTVPDKIFENLMSGATLPSVAGLMRVFEPEVFLGVITIAFIASAETLLCATAIDAMHSGPRAKYNHELKAQGVGNAICGLLAGLPMTATIVRSSANIEAGATSYVSTVLHGFWLLLFVAILPWTLGYIPMASLAAVLVYIGYKLAYPKAVPALKKYGTSEVMIYAMTIIMIVSTDILKGVVTGLVLSLLKLLHAFSHLNVRNVEKPGENRVDVHFDGSATLVRLPILARALESVRPGTDVHVHIDELDYIDHACLDLLGSWEKQHKATGGKLTIDWPALEGKYHARHGSAPKPA